MSEYFQKHFKKKLQVISEVFTSSTVIMIAHRLENVRNMDRVLLMDGGKNIDFDRPLVILSRTPAELKQIIDEKRNEPSLMRTAIEVGFQLTFK